MFHNFGNRITFDYTNHFCEIRLKPEIGKQKIKFFILITFEAPLENRRKLSVYIFEVYFSISKYFQNKASFWKALAFLGAWFLVLYRENIF